jgi:hypothetical protein
MFIVELKKIKEIVIVRGNSSVYSFDILCFELIVCDLADIASITKKINRF